MMITLVLMSDLLLSDSTTCGMLIVACVCSQHYREIDIDVMVQILEYHPFQMTSSANQQTSQ